MKKIKEIKISYWAAHFTTVVSVTMLLVLVGLIGLIGIAAAHTATEVKQEQQVTLIMAEGISDTSADSLMKCILKAPYARSGKVITADEAMKDWNATTGDDVVAVAGYNFFTPEVEIYLNAPYASADSIASIASRLRAEAGVEDVVTPDAQVLSSMDTFFSRTLMLLGGVALAMIVISFMLINNTVLLTIYSRRFTIHTMQLVGATPGFIRRPFIRDNLLAGLISGLCASALLAGVLTFVQQTQMPEIVRYLSWTETGLVMGALTLLGMALCSLSALIATNRYLHKDYDELFT